MTQSKNVLTFALNYAVHNRERSAGADARTREAVQSGFSDAVRAGAPACSDGHGTLKVPIIYKIMPERDWTQASGAGTYSGSADDRRDGFIHFSAAHQLRETAGKHFAGQRDLVLVAVDTAALGPALRWEPSRGGDLFPHLYGTLDVSAARWSVALPLDENGIPVIPEDATSC